MSKLWNFPIPVFITAPNRVPSMADPEDSQAGEGELMCMCTMFSGHFLHSE